MKKLFYIFLTLFFILSNTASVFAKDIVCRNPEEVNNNSGDLSLESKSAILIEVGTGKVIYEKNPDEQLKPASVTKVMTLLLIFEEIEKGNLSFDDVVTVTEHAASMGGSQCFFETGEQQSVHDMIKCIEVASGNDAAVAMAEHIAGTEAAFVEMMNRKAKELGMENTNFENACGLESSNHYTTSRDIAIMSRELLSKYPKIKEYSTIWMDSIIHKTKRGESRFDLANTNKFLKGYTGATGLKTGYTSQAKYCMAASAERNGIEMIAVIMGADTKEIRNSEAAKLLDYGFSKIKIYRDEEVLPKDFYVEVSDGTDDRIRAVPIKNHSIVMINGNIDNVIKNILPYEKLKAPIYENDIIGVIQYTQDGALLDEIYIYASHDVPRLSFSYSLRKISKNIFLIK